MVRVGHSSVSRTKVIYHADGTPFFWVACTAWNGALLSTNEEWEQYLNNRAQNGYNVIQFVTTQWRGCEANRLGQVAFEGCGRIKINVEFFHRHLSPGYYLPQDEAILLARYMVARYGGNHVVWILGGDGCYVAEYEQRWKNIGRGVFGEEHPGLVTLHPQGRSWIGRIYWDEDWLDIIGYQSSHSNARRTVDWINKGPVAHDWDKIPAKPIINLEPNYEEIRFKITARDVRNAAYWSLLAAPTAGITYGANGIWPWLRNRNEKILNHGQLTGYTPWYESINFPGSKQIGYLAKFFRSIEWWRLRPAHQILVEQPGDSVYNHFISVSKTDNHDLIVAYLPVPYTLKLFNPLGLKYKGQWFDPVNNCYLKAEVKLKNGIIEIEPVLKSDAVLVLMKAR